LIMQLTRSEFFKIVFGGSAWLASSGFAPRIAPAVADAARPLPLTAVRLTGGPLKRAQELDAAYLLKLEPDRMLCVSKLEAATVTYVPAGDADAEKAFNQRGEETTIVRADGRAGRRAGRWFSYDVPIGGDGPLALVVTYNSDTRRPRTFEIFVDESRVGDQTLAQSSVSKFFDVEYLLPPAAVAGKTKVAVRFQSTNGNEVAPVFGIRFVKRS